MSATLIPLAALAIIAFVLVAVIRAVRNPVPAPPPPWQGTTLGEEEMRQRREELRDALERTALGIPLARRLWRRLRAEPVEKGLIHEHHRDFCGHGLIRTEDGVKLCDILDGHLGGAAIAEWKDEESFVAFFARQTDFSMSGWDAGEPVFHTRDDWYCNNQRLTRRHLIRYAGRF